MPHKYDARGVGRASGGAYTSPLVGLGVLLQQPECLPRPQQLLAVQHQMDRSSLNHGGNKKLLFENRSTYSSTDKEQVGTIQLLTSQSKLGAKTSLELEHAELSKPSSTQGVAGT